MPCVSAIIPTQDRAAMLRCALASAHEAGEDVEVIVVDDASADETPSLCACPRRWTTWPLKNAASSRDRLAGVAGRAMKRRRHFVADRAVRTHLVIQHDDRTPTGSKNARSFIAGIRGAGASYVYIRLSRRFRVMSYGAAAAIRLQAGGWSYRSGCSTGRNAWQWKSRRLRACVWPHCRPWRHC